MAKEKGVLDVSRRVASLVQVSYTASVIEAGFVSTAPRRSFHGKTSPFAGVPSCNFIVNFRASDERSFVRVWQHRSQQHGHLRRSGGPGADLVRADDEQPIWHAH